MTEDGQISALNGIMDTDAHPKYVNTDIGHVVHRLNLRAGGSRGKKFINRKLKGTTLIPSAMPAGENKVIGWCNDVQNKAVVSFVYNDLGNHSVFRYYTQTDVMEKLWYAEPELGLEDTDLRAVVVEGVVYWVNGGQQPKAFNLDYAANYTNSGTGYGYSDSDAPFSDNIFTLIRKPPRFAPTVSYDSDTDYNFNNLRKRLFQFKYAYVYKDGQISAWSPVSKVPLPVNELGADGKFVDDITKNNLINVVYNSGTRNVEKILFAARDTFPRNTGSFFKFDEVEKYNISTGEQLIGDDSEESVLFYNNKSTTSIDTEINNRYCDWVPLSGKDIALLDGKYLGIAVPEHGYEPVEMDYELTAVEDIIEVEGEVAVFATMEVKNSFVRIQGCTLVAQTLTCIDIPMNFYPNAFYNISFRVSAGPTVSFTIPTGASDANYPRSVRDSFLDQIRDYFSANHPEIYAYVQDKSSSSTRGIALGFADQGWDCGPLSKAIELQGNVTSNLSDILPTSYKSLKRGQYHPIGIIYNDGQGRYNIVFGDEELYSPLPDDDSDEQLQQRVMAQWKINHRPPDWAKTFRWAYIRNKSYTYFQYFSYAKSTEGKGVGEELAGGNGIPNGKYFIELNQSLQKIRNRFPNFVISDYEWQNGDRIRIVGEEKSYEILSEFTWINDEDGDSGRSGFLIDKEMTTHAADVYGNNVGWITLIEVYRPNPSPQNVVYEEIGEEYEILDPGTANRRHQGQIIDQNAALTIPATGILDFGDVYLRQRPVIDTEGNIKLPVIEDEYFNDYYRSDAIDVGRAGAKIESEKKFLNRVIRGENYLENTEYNNLNVFLSGTDYFDASDEYGEITGIENSGDVLKVIQPHKETSVYIGKNYIKQSDGTEIVIASDKVFNSPNRYVEFRGTTYRKSLISNLRYLYYFDEVTGEFVRSSPNGQMAISSYYRMRTWFENKAKELREYSGHKDVITSINNDNNEVYVTFIMGDSWETVVFSEEEENKGWMCFCSLYNDETGPENFAHFGDIMFSFLNGQMWVHDTNETLNLFYGKQHPVALEYYVNKIPNRIKRFKNIRISTNKNIWYIEMTIPEGLNYGNQKTLLKPSVLRAREGQIVSDVLRNIINRKGEESLSLLYKGERMTGEYMKVALTDETSQDVELREIEVKFLTST